MDFKQLEAFVNVAKYKNFSKAAKALYLSQPTVSLHISNLEKELGVSLFDRTSKEVNLTNSGNEFLNYALDLINMKNHAIHDITQTDVALTGSIYIATGTTPNMTIVPEVIKQFADANKKVKFIIEEKSSTAILEDICSLSADIGLVGMHVNNERFISYPLFEDEFVFVCSKDAPIPEVVDFENLTQYNIIHRQAHSATRIELERQFIEQGLDIALLDTVAETDDLNLNMALVSRNVGISYVSKRLYEAYMHTFNIKSFHIKGIESKRQIEMIINRRRTLSPAAEDFKSMVLREYGTCCPKKK